MKKHELLKHAYDNYPKGTKFIQNGHSMVHVASGKYDVNCVTVYDVELDVSLYVYNNHHEKWAEIVSDRHCLFKTHDGVNIYVGDKFYSVNKEKLSFEGWGIDNHIVFTASKGTPEYDNELYFSSHSKALEWIEAQKPKEQSLDLGEGLIAFGRTNSDTIRFEGLQGDLSKEDIKYLYKFITHDLI